MARLALTNRTLVQTGTEIETWLQQFGADGVAIDNTNGNVSVLIKNGNASQATITVDVPTNVDGDLVVPDRTYAIPAGEYWLIKAFSRGTYNQDDSGDSTLTSAVLLDSSITDGTVEITAFVTPKG
jgi:hypothetical protein